MKYMFSKCEEAKDGLLIPGEMVTRWKRQAETKYGGLPENEKASDRKEATVMLAIIANALRVLAMESSTVDIPISPT